MGLLHADAAVKHLRAGETGIKNAYDHKTRFRRSSQVVDTGGGIQGWLSALCKPEGVTIHHSPFKKSAREETKVAVAARASCEPMNSRLLPFAELPDMRTGASAAVLSGTADVAPKEVSAIFDNVLSASMATKPVASFSTSSTSSSSSSLRLDDRPRSL